MEKSQIKELVAAKLKGQGNQTDCGNVLKEVLEDIIDLKTLGIIEIEVGDGEYEEEEDIFPVTSSQSLIDNVINLLERKKIVQVVVDIDGKTMIFSSFVFKDGNWSGFCYYYSTDEGDFTIQTYYMYELRLNKTEGESYIRNNKNI